MSAIGSSFSLGTPYEDTGEWSEDVRNAAVAAGATEAPSTRYTWPRRMPRALPDINTEAR